MAADRTFPEDARIVEELTPLPSLGPTVSPLEADLAMARSHCETQRLALAALQARCDTLHEDRRALAERVRQLEKQLQQAKKPASK